MRDGAQNCGTRRWPPGPRKTYSADGTAALRGNIATTRQMTKTYTLTATEAAIYDSDDEKTNGLMADLRQRFGRIAGGSPVETEVRHPDGFMVMIVVGRVIARDCGQNK